MSKQTINGVPDGCDWVQESEGSCTRESECGDYFVAPAP